MIVSERMQAAFRLQHVRLASGLVLFTFVTLHLINHACGLISVAAMNQVQDWRLALTQSLPGTALLLAAVLAHVGLALVKLAQRNTLRMSRWEAVQIVSGLCIPVLLIPHLVSASYLGRVAGIDYSYTSMVHQLWPKALTQGLLVLVVWTHGCIGLHFWKRHKPRYRRWSGVLQALAVALPLLALAGFITAARELQPSWATPEMLARTAADLTAQADAIAAKDRLVQLVLKWFGASVATALVIFSVRALVSRAAPRIRVSFVDGPTVQGARGSTLHQRHSAYVDVWWSSPLLNLPGPGRSRGSRAATTSGRRGHDAGTDQGSRKRPAGLSIAANRAARRDPPDQAATGVGAIQDRR
jgi:adenylate cyclase